MTMRYLMKGGYWKNSEDEILKAAIMKYGLNQWARIASLMSRKSVKQCKSRWYEWIDPSIKKTDWTREEEERLLHLARLFPAQWRTIAPMLSRTPQMCIEHYERLLDMTMGRTYDDDNDPRKLLPGEIDALAEHRPARADPVDMDDDEREMIAEARVRIANRKGKKEKRKARERTLEEARRLATIQKFRELRNAGVDFVIERKDKKKVKLFSYGSEIPMERLPFEVGNRITEDELARANKSDVNVTNLSIAELEGQRREDSELKKRQEDYEKIKKLRMHNLPQQLARSKINDPTQIYGREELQLEEPQLKDSEIEELYRLNKRSASQFRKTNSESLGASQSQANSGVKNDDFQCTDVLLADSDVNSFQNLVAKIRTPKASASIMQQAKEMIQINDPKVSFDSSTIMDNKSVSMAPSIAKSKVSTPNPLKQLIQNFNRQKDGHSKLRSESEFNYSQANLAMHQNAVKGSNVRDSNQGDSKSQIGGYSRLQDHLSVHFNNNEDFFNNTKELQNNNKNEASLANFEAQNIKMKIERSAFLKSVFASLPLPTNNFKIDSDELMKVYDEIVGHKIGTEDKILDNLLPKIPELLKVKIRKDLLQAFKNTDPLLENQNKSVVQAFENICERIDIKLNDKSSNGRFDVNEDIIKQINRKVQEKCDEILKSSKDGLIEELASEILRKCEENTKEKNGK